MQRLSVHGQCSVSIENEYLLRADRQLCVVTDPVHGIAIMPMGLKSLQPYVYSVGEVPMCLNRIQLSGQAHLIVRQAKALSPLALHLEANQDAVFECAVPTWLDECSVRLRRGARVDGRRSMMTGRLTVDGNDTTTILENFVVQEQVSVVGCMAVNAVRVECTTSTRVVALPGLVHVTSLLTRVIPQVPTTFFAGPCQYCLSAGGALSGGCGHLFVCQSCVDEHGTERIFNAPCPLCRSTVRTLLTPPTSRCASLGLSSQC